MGFMFSRNGLLRGCCVSSVLEWKMRDTGPLQSLPCEREAGDCQYFESADFSISSIVNTVAMHVADSLEFCGEPEKPEDSPDNIGLWEADLTCQGCCNLRHVLALPQFLLSFAVLFLSCAVPLLQSLNSAMCHKINEYYIYEFAQPGLGIYYMETFRPRMLPATGTPLLLSIKMDYLLP